MLQVIKYFGVKALLLLMAAFFALGGLCYWAGIRINTTESIPLGVYWLTDRPVTPGDYVIFCPPERVVFNLARDRGYISAGYCPGSYSHMMKRVEATGGDWVSVTPGAVYVNGKALVDSAQKAVDLGGRSMPSYQLPREQLVKGQYLLMGENPISFDARYFGLIDENQVNGVIRPIFTWSS